MLRGNRTPHPVNQSYEIVKVHEAILYRTVEFDTEARSKIRSDSVISLRPHL